MDASPLSDDCRTLVGCGFVSNGVIEAEGTPEEILASSAPFVHQFIHGEEDGPVPFHYPAADYAHDLGLGART